MIGNSRQMHPKKPKGLGLGFQFFDYLGFAFGFGYLEIFCGVVYLSYTNKYKLIKTLKITS